MPPDDTSQHAIDANRLKPATHKAAAGAGRAKGPGVKIELESG